MKCIILDHIGVELMSVKMREKGCPLERQHTTTQAFPSDVDDSSL